MVEIFIWLDREEREKWKKGPWYLMSSFIPYGTVSIKKFLLNLRRLSLDEEEDFARLVDIYPPSMCLAKLYEDEERLEMTCTGNDDRFGYMFEGELDPASEAVEWFANIPKEVKLMVYKEGKKVAEYSGNEARDYLRKCWEKIPAEYPSSYEWYG